jgi:hypothetical protein
LRLAARGSFLQEEQERNVARAAPILPSPLPTVAALPLRKHLAPAFVMWLLEAKGTEGSTPALHGCDSELEPGSRRLRQADDQMLARSFQARNALESKHLPAWQMLEMGPFQLSGRR